MKLRKLILIYSIYVFCSACSGISVEHVTGKYYLTKIDYQEKDLSLSYKLNNNGGFVGIIEPYILSIGFNDEYIIVKQKVTEDVGNKVYYFIIPLKNSINDYPDENKIGPLEYSAFSNKLKELNQFDKLSFTMHY